MPSMRTVPCLLAPLGGRLSHFTTCHQSWEHCWQKDMGGLQDHPTHAQHSRSPKSARVDVCMKEPDAALGYHD